MKARWFWSRWLLPPCDDEIHHSCREAERMLQACGEGIVMTAVNIISFYFHTTDIMFSLRHRQGSPCFCLPAAWRRSHSSSGLISGIISIDSTCWMIVLAVHHSAWGVTDGYSGWTEMVRATGAAAWSHTDETWWRLTVRCPEWTRNS